MFKCEKCEKHPSLCKCYKPNIGFSIREKDKNIHLRKLLIQIEDFAHQALISQICGINRYSHGDYYNSERIGFDFNEDNKRLIKWLNHIKDALGIKD